MTPIIKDHLADQIYNFLSRHYNFNKHMKILPVDFDKPWWVLISKQKLAFGLMITFAIVDSVFGTVFPILIGIAIATVNWQLLLIIILARIGLSLLSGVIGYISTVFQFKSAQSIAYSANLFFLTTDPVNHSTKSSGQIISKINRGSSRYEAFLEMLGTELIPTIINLITVPIILFRFQYSLGLSSIAILIVVATVSSAGIMTQTRVFEPKIIVADDEQNALAIESLQQAPYIRYCFATIEQGKRLYRTTVDLMTTGANSWQFDRSVGILTQVLSYSGMIWISWQIFALLQARVIDPITAAALIISYYTSSERMVFAGTYVRNLNINLYQIQDLFTFIRGFGKASYPVLEGIENNPKV